MISHFGTGFTYRLPGETITRGCACGDRSNCFGCETYEKYKQYAPPPATNFDRIHRMPLEEFAEFASDLSCHPAATRESCLLHFDGQSRNCVECWLDWLRYTAEERT